MPNPGTIERWRKDRERLTTVLRDFQSGKAAHLRKAEVDVVIARLKERIAALKVKIGEGENASRSTRREAASRR